MTMTERMQATRQQINRLHYEGLIFAILTAHIPDTMYIMINRKKVYGDAARDALPLLFATHALPGVIKRFWQDEYIKNRFIKLLNEDCSWPQDYKKAGTYDEILESLRPHQADYLIRELYAIRNDSPVYAEFRDKVKAIQNGNQGIGKSSLFNSFINKFKR